MNTVNSKGQVLVLYRKINKFEGIKESYYKTLKVTCLDRENNLYEGS